MLIYGDATDETDDRGRPITGDTLLLLFNAGDDAVRLHAADDERRRRDLGRDGRHRARELYVIARAWSRRDSFALAAVRDDDGCDADDDARTERRIAG